MKLSNLIISGAIITSIGWLASCGSESVKKDEKPVDVQELTKDQPEVHGTEVKESDITLGTPLDQAMVSTGKATYELKCQSCHKLTEEKLVGPGWKGVTQRQTAPWLLNFITNPDPMIDKDPELQAQLEICLVRMPNQNLTDDEARKLLEFMRQNDGVQ